MLFSMILIFKIQTIFHQK